MWRCEVCGKPWCECTESHRVIAGLRAENERLRAALGALLMPIEYDVNEGHLCTICESTRGHEEDCPVPEAQSAYNAGRKERPDGA